MRRHLQSDRLKLSQLRIPMRGYEAMSNTFDQFDSLVTNPHAGL